MFTFLLANEQKILLESYVEFSFNRSPLFPDLLFHPVCNNSCSLNLVGKFI
uniref:Uncharacterized protein n=1 Tax=Oryza brachyantha TaxID=4533 RepID=J3MFL6_ORYBR